MYISVVGFRQAAGRQAISRRSASTHPWSSTAVDASPQVRCLCSPPLQMLRTPDRRCGAQQPSSSRIPLLRRWFAPLPPSSPCCFSSRLFERRSRLRSEGQPPQRCCCSLYAGTKTTAACAHDTDLWSVSPNSRLPRPEAPYPRRQKLTLPQRRHATRPGSRMPD